MSKNFETELTHSYNLMSIAIEQLETAIDSGNFDNAPKLLSLFIKSKDTLLEQLDEVAEYNVTHALKKSA